MPVKYNREGFRDKALGTQNRYEVRSRFAFRDPRKRLIVIYVGLGFMSIAILVFHFAAQRTAIGWLEERQGNGAVLEKKIKAEGTPDQQFVLVVKVLVPPADEAEASLVPKDLPNRAETLGPLELIDHVRTSEANWRALLPGTPLKVQYQIDARRTRVKVRGLSLDEAPPESVSGQEKP